MTDPKRLPPVPNELLRAGRVAVGMSRADLADKASLSAATIGAIERDSTVSLSTLAATRDALAASGITFIPSGGQPAGPGLRLPPEMDDAAKRVVRAAAAALGKNTEELAKLAGVGERSVVRLLQPRGMREATLARMRAALSQNGIEFLARTETMGPGFRLRLDLVGRTDLRV